MGRRGRGGTGDVEPARVGPLLGVCDLRRRLRDAKRGEGAVEDQSVGARPRRPSAEDLVLPVVPRRDDARKQERGPTSRLDRESGPRGERASIGGMDLNRDLGIENGGTRPMALSSGLESGARPIDERPSARDRFLFEQQEGPGRIEPGGARHLLAADEMGRFAPGNQGQGEYQPGQPSFRWMLRPAASARPGPSPLFRRLKDHSISNSATMVPSFWRPIERAAKTTPSPVATARSIAARIAAPSAKVKVASCVALRVKRAESPVTSVETRAEARSRR